MSLSPPVSATPTPPLPALTPIRSYTTCSVLAPHSLTSATSFSVNSASIPPVPPLPTLPNPCTLGNHVSHCIGRRRSSLRRIKLPGSTGKHALLYSMTSWHIYTYTSNPRCRVFRCTLHALQLENGTTLTKLVRTAYIPSRHK